MKSKIHLLSIGILVFALAFTSCKKKDAVDDSSQYGTITDDGTRVNNETDAVATDAVNSVEGTPSVGGGRVEGIICDATVTPDSVNHKLTIVYNGTNCNGSRTRTGTVVVQLASSDNKWATAGATLSITFQNLKITRISDSKSITINGTKTITNVSGGLVKNLSSLGHITHTITSSGMIITFDDGSQRTWSISKQRDFTYDNGAVIATSGTGTDGVALAGSNRYGNPFSFAITSGQPLIFRQDCDWRLTGGQVIFQKLVRTVTVTFGLDVQGNPTTCPSAGGTYWFKATWTNAKGTTVDIIHAY